MHPAGQCFQVVQYTRKGFQETQARVITEAPVSLTVNGQVWLTFTCTPALLEELALGFLFNEGVIQSHNDVLGVHVCKDATNIDVYLHHTPQRPTHWQRTSGCTGGVTSAEPALPTAPLTDFSPVDADMLLDNMELLFRSQELYREVRGVHCSALSDGERVVLQAEDIGRHNTIDKIAGLLLRHPLELSRRILLTTGRVSSEMLQKSARIHAGVVLSRTSPTSRSIELAERLGITLIGYARRDQFTVYAHPQRLAFAAGDVLRLETTRLVEC